MYDHHIWIVRTTVGVALQTLGTCKDILTRVRGACPEEKATEMIPCVFVGDEWGE